MTTLYPRAIVDGKPVSARFERRRYQHWRKRWMWLPDWLPHWRAFGAVETREYDVAVLDEAPPASASVFISYETSFCHEPE